MGVEFEEIIHGSFKNHKRMLQESAYTVCMSSYPAEYRRPRQVRGEFILRCSKFRCTLAVLSRLAAVFSRIAAQPARIGFGPAPHEEQGDSLFCVSAPGMTWEPPSDFKISYFVFFLPSSRPLFVLFRDTSSALQ